MNPTPPDLDRIAAAFQRKEYRSAARLLNPLLKTHGDDPWVQLYAARLHELSGKGHIAEPIYRTLLRNTQNPNPKILSQARQGLQRLENQDKQSRQAALEQARTTPQNAKPGLLVLEPLGDRDRKAAAQQAARILNLDPYSARMILPARHWRLYRLGPLGELQVYGEDLNRSGVPCFVLAIAALHSPQVFRVQYLRGIKPNPTVVCQNADGRLGAIAFQWSEVAQRVSGQVPIFESVVDTDARGNLVRRENTQDYALLSDLHLPARNTILRFCESSYQFDRGVQFSPMPFLAEKGSQLRPTRRTHWNAIGAYLTQQLPDAPHLKDFDGFASSALDETELLGKIKPHIDLFRREETLWDSAFQLYSAIAFGRWSLQSPSS
jgi:hypothetical protein